MRRQHHHKPLLAGHALDDAQHGGRGRALERDDLADLADIRVSGSPFALGAVGAVGGLAIGVPDRAVTGDFDGDRKSDMTCFDLRRAPGTR